MSEDFIYFAQLRAASVAALCEATRTDDLAAAFFARLVPLVAGAVVSILVRLLPFAAGTGGCTSKVDLDGTVLGFVRLAAVTACFTATVLECVGTLAVGFDGLGFSRLAPFVMTSTSLLDQAMALTWQGRPSGF